jgi:uncharacterized protein YndB with AHSA1/START domain
MITIRFEQARGMRELYPTGGSFQASATRAVKAPVAALYEAWEDAGTRKRWLGGKPVTIRRANPSKSMRLIWADGRTRVHVKFQASGENRSRVSLSHRKLPSADEAKHMKEFWTGVLAKLSRLLEK